VNRRPDPLPRQVRRGAQAAVLAAVGVLCLVACGNDGGSGDAVVQQLALTPLPTVGGVGVLPAVVEPTRERLVVVTRPIKEDGTVAELIGEQIIGNRILVIGDSIMASTATRYTGYMCDDLVPLGWSVAVEAEPSRFIDFGNRVLDRRLDPTRGEDFDWDAAVVHLGSNYGNDQERFEAELRLILARLAPRPTLLFTVTQYKPSYAQANESIRKLAAEFENVTLLDWEQVSKYPGVLSGDRLHPTDDGRHVLVDMVAEALGPATLGQGECLKSQFTDDSAARRGGSGPASNPSGGGSGGSTATTVRPTTTVGGGGASTTISGGGGGGGGGGGTGGSTTVPATAPAPNTTTATTAAPTTAAPTTAAPTTAAPTAPAPTTPTPGPTTPDGGGGGGGAGGDGEASGG
jgi:hypothetical protein